jgi:hypothetical protein
MGTELDDNNSHFTVLVERITSGVDQSLCKIFATGDNVNNYQQWRARLFLGRV